MANKMYCRIHRHVDGSKIKLPTYDFHIGLQYIQSHSHKYLVQCKFHHFHSPGNIWLIKCIVGYIGMLMVQKLNCQHTIFTLVSSISSHTVTNIWCSTSSTIFTVRGTYGYIRKCIVGYIGMLMVQKLNCQHTIFTLVSSISSHTVTNIWCSTSSTIFTVRGTYGYIRKCIVGYIGMLMVQKLNCQHTIFTLVSSISSHTVTNIWCSTSSTIFTVRGTYGYIRKCIVGYIGMLMVQKLNCQHTIFTLVSSISSHTVTNIWCSASSSVFTGRVTYG